MSKIATAMLALVLAAPVLAGGLSKYKDWDGSPEAYYLSSAERAKWTTVDSDDAAEKFISEYKAARGKGFAGALKSRIDVADKTFKAGKAKGARSPIGRVLIVLGAPASTQRASMKAKSKADVVGSDVVGGGGATGGGKSGGSGSAENTLSNTGGPGANSMRGLRVEEPTVVTWVYQAPNIPPGAGDREFTIEYEEDAAGGIVMKDPAQVEAIIQKVIEYWAPKAK